MAEAKSNYLATLGVLLCVLSYSTSPRAADKTTAVRTATDGKLFPKAYGILANEHLMYPVDMSDWPITIDRSRQLFVDDYLIASTEGTKRTVHQATKHTGNPVLVGDKRWEGGGPVGQVVRRDAATGRFRMWYSGRSRYGPRSGETTEYPVMYAESKDGINWEKPVLQLYERDGSKANNIVIPDGRMYGLMDEPEDAASTQRYKAVIWHEPPYVRREGYFLYVSPDGIHWTRETKESLAIRLEVYAMPQTGIGDTSIFRWDRHLRKYVGDVKLQLPNRFRCRGIMESNDLVHWSRPRMTIYPDGLDDPDSQIYSQLSFCYESMWLGFLRVMHTERTKGSKQTTVELTASRDGRHWTRVGTREEILPLGTEAEWDTDYHAPCWDPIPVGDELWIYYRSGRMRHDEHRQMAIGLARIRQDGFVSLDAGADAGLVVTRPMTFKGTRLYVNAKVAEGGTVQVALLSAGREPLADYTLDDSMPFTENSTHAPVRWQERDEIHCPEGGHVRLQFRLRNAMLYSFLIE
jgi:hypothetical protein